jgi:isocitrate lyase
MNEATGINWYQHCPLTFALCPALRRLLAVQLAIARGLAYAPYADLIWCETSTPDMEDAREFAGV